MRTFGDLSAGSKRQKMENGSKVKIMDVGIWLLFLNGLTMIRTAQVRSL